MHKRFLWSIIWTAIISAVLVPVNLNLLDLAPPPTTLPGQLKPLLNQGQLNFFSLMYIEINLTFLTAFVVMNAYFDLHPGYRSIFGNRDVPEKYLKDPTKDNT
jgi:hypothetical protein